MALARGRSPGRVTRRARIRSDHAGFVHEGHDVPFVVAKEGHRQLVCVGSMNHMGCLAELHTVAQKCLVGLLYVCRPEVQNRRGRFHPVWPAQHQTGSPQVEKRQPRSSKKERNPQHVAVERGRPVYVVDRDGDLPHLGQSCA